MRMHVVILVVLLASLQKLREREREREKEKERKRGGRRRGEKLSAVQEQMIEHWTSGISVQIMKQSTNDVGRERERKRERERERILIV